jgi:hypothetical protein
LSCLLPGPAGDKIVEVVVGEHHFFALLAATDVDVTKVASADEAAKRTH